MADGVSKNRFRCFLPKREPRGVAAVGCRNAVRRCYHRQQLQRRGTQSGVHLQFFLGEVGGGGGGGPEAIHNLCFILKIML
jgi:hypothetical protein